MHLQSSSGFAQIVDLATPFIQLSPAASLRALADECDRLKIDQRDFYGAGASWLTEFEASVATFTRKEAALYVPSGTMAQQIALAVYREEKDPTAPFVAHHTSHLLVHEQDSFKHLLSAPVLICGPRVNPVDYESFDKTLVDHSDAGGIDPFCAIIEVPHRECGGAMTSIEDIRKIKTRCIDTGTKLHCDGARLYEALGGKMGANKDELLDSFDSVYISFYKGLGGMTGAMLSGTTHFIEKSRIWLRRYGGNLYNNLPYAVSGLSAIDQLGSSFVSRYTTLQRYVSVIRATAVKTGATDYISFWPEEVTACMTHVHLKASPAVCASILEQAEKETDVKVCPRIRGDSYLHKGWSYFEWNLGPANSDVSSEMVEKGWTAVLKKLCTAEQGV